MGGIFSEPAKDNDQGLLFKNDDNKTNLSEQPKPETNALNLQKSPSVFFSNNPTNPPNTNQNSSIFAVSNQPPQSTVFNAPTITAQQKPPTNNIFAPQTNQRGTMFPSTQSSVFQTQSNIFNNQLSGIFSNRGQGTTNNIFANTSNNASNNSNNNNPFGGNAGFGSSSGFGTSGAFGGGQTQNLSNIFSVGNNAFASTGNSGGGLFGNQNNTQNNQGFFESNKPNPNQNNQENFF